MTRRAPRLEWVPPLLIGVSAAVIAEVSMSMLLYGGPGFVRSLTTVLAVQGLAFAGGLWSRPSADRDLVDRLRRRWLLCLGAFVVAAVFGTGWSVFPALSEGGLGQGAGLALLAALPLYAAGGVLGGMSVLAATDAGERLAAPGAAAAAGAALGFVLTGLALPRVPRPASLILVALVLLSLGGMVYGGVLAFRTEVRELGRRPGRGTEVSVEERRRSASDLAVRELREGGTVRRWIPLGRAEPVPWDVAVLRGTGVLRAMSEEPADPGESDEGPDRPRRVLLVGGGASPAVRAFVEGASEGTVDVVERTAAVVELGRDHFDTGLSVGRNGRSAVAVGNLDDAIAACDGSYDLVVVDSTALEPIGGVAGLSTMARRRLPALVRPGGVLAWGPEADGLGFPAPGGGWESRRYRRRVRVGDEEALESVALVRRDDGEPWRPVLGGFKEVPPP